MTTPDADGWITHDGGPCPVGPDVFTERAYGGVSCFGPSSDGTWEDVKRYRIFVAAHTVTHGPSPFVRDTAARIMATTVSSDAFLAVMDEGDTQATLDATAAFAVRAAQALEAALKEVKP